VNIFTIGVHGTKGQYLWKISQSEIVHPDLEDPRGPANWWSCDDGRPIQCV